MRIFRTPKILRITADFLRILKNNVRIRKKYFVHPQKVLEDPQKICGYLQSFGVRNIRTFYFAFFFWPGNLCMDMLMGSRTRVCLLSRAQTFPIIRYSSRGPTRKIQLEFNGERNFSFLRLVRYVMFFLMSFGAEDEKSYKNLSKLMLRTDF